MELLRVRTCGLVMTVEICCKTSIAKLADGRQPVLPHHPAECRGVYLQLHTASPTLGTCGIWRRWVCESQAKLQEELQPMDLWLLGRGEELWAEWSPPQRACRLNALERLLLATSGGPGAMRRCAADMHATVQQAAKSR